MTEFADQGALGLPVTRTERSKGHCSSGTEEGPRRNAPGMASMKRMPDREFRAMKSKLRSQRHDAVRAFCMALAPESAEEWIGWCLAHHGHPPPPSMVAWDKARGSTRICVGTRAAEGSSGFGGELIFAQGDMISFAARAAQSRRVCVLNMANRSTPGGGFLSACRAQEEQLCHRSDLFPRLKLHRAYDGYPISRGSALLTPEVGLLLDGADQGFTPTPHVRVSVVSAAANSYGSEASARRDVNLRATVDANWRAVLAAAGQSGAQLAVLSALGCGAFRNPTEEVAASLARVLREPIEFGWLEAVAVVVMEDHNRFRQRSTLLAYVVMAYLVMACIVTAFLVMGYIVMATTASRTCGASSHRCRLRQPLMGGWHPYL